MEKIKSGVPGLDGVLGGGLLKNSVIAVTGPTGAGKSTLAMQFLVNGILESKEPGLYIAIEETHSSVYFHMSSYSWELDKLEKNKKLLFLDYPVLEVDQFLAQNSAIQELINRIGVRRVVIDSVMPVALFFNNDDERKKGFIKLMENIRKWQTTTLIISEDVPATTQDVLPATRYGIESFTDGWIHIYYLFSPKERERTRAIEIIKMKGAAHSSKIYPAEITKNGFVVYSKTK